MDDLTRMTELQASSGTNMVMAGIVMLSVIGAITVLGWYLRRRLSIELEITQQRLAEEQRQRDEEREERRRLMGFVLERAGAIMGDGNGRTGILEQVLSRLKHGDVRFGEIAHEQAQIRAAQDALRAEVRGLPCQDEPPCPVPTMRLATEG